MLTMDLSQPVDIQFEQRPDFYTDLNPTTLDDYEEDMDGMLTFTRSAYDQATVVSLIQPKEMGGETESDGFFSSLGSLIADHPFAVIFSLLMLLGAAGTAATPSDSKLKRTSRTPSSWLNLKKRREASGIVVDPRRLAGQGVQSFWLR